VRIVAVYAIGSEAVNESPDGESTQIAAAAVVSSPLLPVIVAFAPKIVNDISSATIGESVDAIGRGPRTIVPDSTNVPGYGPAATPKAVNLTVPLPSGAQLTDSLTKRPATTSLAESVSPSSVAAGGDDGLAAWATGMSASAAINAAARNACLYMNVPPPYRNTGAHGARDPRFVQ
jgi:hypothetical protein